MNRYSVFYLRYGKRYYLTHPWAWFKDAYINLKSAWMRATRGWCYSDVWDWDVWFMRVVPNMLRHMAEHGSAYPGREPFNTPERWHDWLNEMADLIESGDEQWQDEHNEYYKEYINSIMSKPWKLAADYEKHHIPLVDPEIKDKYWARSKELSEQGEKNIKFALESIGSHFYNIWD